MAPDTNSILSVSCINVGVGPGGTTNLIALVGSVLELLCTQVHIFSYALSRRIAIVDYRGATLFDKYVIPTTIVSTLNVTF